MKRQNLISAHVVQFCRFLRGHQFNLGPLEETLTLEALSVISYEKPKHFKEALRSTLVKSKLQLDQFEDLYGQYWSEVRRSEDSKQKEVLEEQQTQSQKAKAPSLSVIKKWLHGNHQNDLIEMATFDDTEVFTEQDFSSFKKDDLRNALKFSDLLVKKLSNKKGRRFINSNRRKTIDLRKVIRKNISKSDEIIHLNYREKKLEKLRIVLICDVSRSMELYSKFLIQFMYGLNRASTKIETFVFSTKLVRISNHLKVYDFETVLERLKESFDHWSGGTKIGSSLTYFTDHFAAQYLDQKTNVIIVSDGWDTENDEQIDRTFVTIKKKCSKVIWLNPLAGNPNFKPETACLKAAMPYVDIFHAANSIEDLKELVKNL